MNIEVEQRPSGDAYSIHYGDMLWTVGYFPTKGTVFTPMKKVKKIQVLRTDPGLIIFTVCYTEETKIHLTLSGDYQIIWEQ